MSKRRKEKTLTCAFELGAVLVGAEETVRHAVAQLGHVVDLQHVDRLVHLAAEVALVQVQKEDLAARRYRSFQSRSCCWCSTPNGGRLIGGQHFRLPGAQWRRQFEQSGRLRRAGRNERRPDTSAGTRSRSASAARMLPAELGRNLIEQKKRDERGYATIFEARRDDSGNDALSV